MKKIGLWLLSALMILCMMSYPAKVEVKAEVDLAPGATSAILIDYDTKEVLFEKNSEEKLYPASMTKMMGLLLIMEAIHRGTISFDTEVTASENAASMGGSQIYLQPGETMIVSDMIKAICIVSANDAMTAMAEKLGGSVDQFVEMMNDKAQELGCTSTHFVNPTGLHDENHYSSAKDMAIIAQALIKEGQDDILRYTSTYDDYIRESTDNKFWLVNTNKLVRTYQGMDGLKTGYTAQSMYCLTATALRDDLRLIAVVMHEPNKESRNKDVAALLDYGFSNYSKKILLEKGTKVETLGISKGKPSSVNLIVKDNISILQKNNEEISEVNRKVTCFDFKLPVYSGDTVGTLTMTLSNGKTVTQELSVEQDVLSLDFLDIFIKTIVSSLF